jgi:hypothetical protein
MPDRRQTNLHSCPKRIKTQTQSERKGYGRLSSLGRGIPGHSDGILRLVPFPWQSLTSAEPLDPRMPMKAFNHNKPFNGQGAFDITISRFMSDMVTEYQKNPS